MFRVKIRKSVFFLPAHSHSNGSNTVKCLDARTTTTTTTTTTVTMTMTKTICFKVIDVVLLYVDENGNIPNGAYNEVKNNNYTDTVTVRKAINRLSNSMSPWHLSARDKSE